MKFVKNKSKVVLYYLFLYLFISSTIALISICFFKSNALILIAFSEIVLLITIIAFFHLHVAECKQTVEVLEDVIVCENFIIQGKISKAKINYQKIERITLKRDLLKPWTFYLCVYISGDRPFILNDDYVNYVELWRLLCSKCKSKNCKVFIDSRIWEKVNINT